MTTKKTNITKPRAIKKAEEVIIPTNTASSDYINSTSREYSLYVCSSRAIPNVTDGLKDSQRKALWIIRNKSEKIKVISLAGEMISENLYLAGDASAGSAISMLAAPFVNNIPLIDGIGAFGTRVAPVDGIGAPRYTYAKRSKAAEALLYRDMDVVPLVDNYDGSTKQPAHFLPLIPLVLLNGVSGIAVGWSTDILPRNLKKLINATQQALMGKKITGLEPSYDYLNVGVSNIAPNVWEFSGKVEIVNSSTALITELPPNLNLEAFRKRLMKMEDEDQIVNFTDNSTKEIHISVQFKRGELKGWTESQLIDFFKLKQKATERIVVIDWNGESIRQYEKPEDVVSEFIDFRLKWYTYRYQNILNNDEYELNYWKAVKACFDQKLPEQLIKKKNKGEIEQAVATIAQTAKVEVDAMQVDKIASLPTYRWAADYLATVKERITELQANIKANKALLKNPQAIRDIYYQELEDLKKLK